MKEDHIKNVQLKPACNWQFSTNNQFVVNYTVEQTTTDTTNLLGHLDEHENLYGEYPCVQQLIPVMGAKRTMNLWKRTILNHL